MKSGLIPITEIDKYQSLLKKYGAIILLFALAAVFSALKPNAFFTWDNALSIIGEGAPHVLIAAGLTFVMVMRDVDISVGATAGVAGVTIAALISTEPGAGGTGIGLPFYLAFILTLLIGLTVGLINGLLVAKVGIPPFLLTFAMMIALVGVQLAVVGPSSIYRGMPEIFAVIGRGKIIGIDYIIIISAVLCLLLWLSLEYTAIGRKMYAIGGSKATAHLSGINIFRYSMIAFCVCSLCAALTGILIAARLNTSYSELGMTLLLPAFSAAFIGTAIFKPGRFQIPGTVVAVLLIRMTITGLRMFFLPLWALQIIEGSILIVAVLLARFGANR